MSPTHNKFWLAFFFTKVEATESGT